MTTIETILTSGINDANAEQLKSLIREQYDAMTAAEFRQFADAHRLPVERSKVGTLRVINSLIDNQAVLAVQTAR